MIPIYVAGVLLILFIIIAIIHTRDKKNRGQDWGAYPGDDTAVIATNPRGEKVRVELPAGVKYDDVSAVYVGVKTEKAKVKVLHEKTNRRDIDPGSPPDHDMEL